MSRFLDHREAGKIFHDFEKHKDRYLIIHYSCESFFDTTGATPRITDIAVKSPSSGQTELFAVHKAAELMKIKPEDIVERYEEVERMMLDDFFTFESVWGKFFFWIVNLLIGGFAGGYIGKLFF